MRFVIAGLALLVLAVAPRAQQSARAAQVVVAREAFIVSPAAVEAVARQVAAEEGFLSDTTDLPGSRAVRVPSLALRFGSAEATARFERSGSRASRPGALMTLALDPSATGSEVLLAESYAAAVRDRILAADPVALGGTRPLPQMPVARWWPRDPRLGGTIGAVVGCASMPFVLWAAHGRRGSVLESADIACLLGGVSGYVIGYTVSSGGEGPPF